MEKAKRIREDFPKDRTDLRLLFKVLEDIVETASMRGEQVKVEVYILQPVK